MMASAPRLNPTSVEDYLAGEQHSKMKHEYVAGKVYAMVGGRYRHNLIASNVLGELHAQLKGKPCRALNSDSKVRVQTGTWTRFYYPDASVVCGKNLKDGVFQDKPTIVAEVLSESTRRTDEGEKLEAYRQIETLSVYMMFEQNGPAAVVYRRSGTEFLCEVYSDPESMIRLPEVGVELRLASVYEEVGFVAE